MGERSEGYPGEQLGMPEEGPGAAGGFGRRLVAIIIDWVICLWAIAPVLVPAADPSMRSLVALGIFALANIVLISTAGYTLGQRLARIRVAALDGGRPGFVPVIIRTLLLCLAIPAMVFDRDQRGLHDRAAGTVVVRL